MPDRARPSRPVRYDAPNPRGVRGAAPGRREDRMGLPRPLVDARARGVIEAVDVPVTVASAVRDRDARLLDFRLEYANAAAHRWAGREPGTIVGRLLTDLIPGLRPNGLYDALVEVVVTGHRFRQLGQSYEGNVEDGRSFAAVFDLLAIRHGDGYVSVWQERRDGGAARDLDAIAQATAATVPLVRLEAREHPVFRLRPAT
jgi:PAS domain-containing protein